jgi:D-galacturonate reductase
LEQENILQDGLVKKVPNQIKVFKRLFEGCGVVGLVHFDLRYRNVIGKKIVMVGTNGKKFEQIREHLKQKI